MHINYALCIYTCVLDMWSIHISQSNCLLQPILNYIVIHIAFSNFNYFIARFVIRFVINTNSGLSLKNEIEEGTLKVKQGV